MIQTVLASYFTSTPDPLPKNKYRQHVLRDRINNKFWDNNYYPLLPLVDSVIKNEAKILIFHDCFEDTPIIDGCSWIKVDYDFQYAPTIYRWFVYYNHLKNNKYDNLFMVDSTDVIMLKNSVLLNNMLYCGSQYNRKFFNLHNLDKKRKHINISDFNSIYNHYYHHTLLNAGVVGGDYNICYHFLEKLTFYHEQTSKNIHISLDMPIFNYVLFKYFYNNIIYGDDVTTKFAEYKENNKSLWKHK